MTAIALPNFNILKFPRGGAQHVLDRVKRMIPSFGGLYGGIGAGDVGLATRRAAAAPPLLDGLTAVAVAYSPRKLRAAYAGSALRVRRDSDDDELDIGFAGNDFNGAAFTAFVGGGNGFCSVYYDQSGSGIDLSQASPSAQPQIILNVLNGHPVLRFSGSQYLRNASDAGLPDADMTAFLVSYCNLASISSGNYNNLVNYGVTGGTRSIFLFYATESSGTNALGATQYGDSFAISNRLQVWNLETIYHSGDDWTEIVNTLDPATRTMATNTALGNDFTLGAFSSGIGGGGYLTGDIAEVVICGAVQDESARLAAVLNINSYYAIY